MYYYGARYYDPQVGYWNTVDPALLNGRYFPKPNDFDSAHDYYWQIQDDEKNKLPGMGGVYNAVNMNVYQYGGLNPMVMIDPDGNVVIHLAFTDKYLYLQQKPRNADGSFAGFRAGVTTEAEGRYIDPTGGGLKGLLGKQTITFWNNNPTQTFPNGSSTDTKVSFELAEGIENVTRATGQTYNLNSLVRTGPNQGTHGTRQAFDCNRINGRRVYDMYQSNDLGEINIFQNVLAQQNIYQNYGPSRMEITRTGANRPAPPRGVAPHIDHVHGSFKPE